MSKRIKVEGYAGIYYRLSRRIGRPGKERVYYAVYKTSDGKVVETKLGRQFKDNMTPSKASKQRAELIEGRRLTRQEQRKKTKALSEIEASRWTIQRLWEEYKRCNPNLKGWRSYKSNYRLYIKDEFGSKEPRELTPLDIDRFRLNLLKTYRKERRKPTKDGQKIEPVLLSPQSVKHTINLLRRIINFGNEKGLCETIRFKIKTPKVNNEVTEDLTERQLSNLLVAMENDEHHQAGKIMKMALFLGLRKSEIFRLKWEHIDFNRGFVRIVDPKRGEDATVPLNEAAEELLKSTPREAEFVFPGRGGGQRTTIASQVRRIRDKAGISPSFRPLHGLRHVYASMLASSGKVDMYTLQKLLTHKDPKMTQRYAHLRDDALKKASELAGNLVKAAVAENKVNEGEDENGSSNPENNDAIEGR